MSAPPHPRYPAAPRRAAALGARGRADAARGAARARGGGRVAPTRRRRRHRGRALAGRAGALHYTPPPPPPPPPPPHARPWPLLCRWRRGARLYDTRRPSPRPPRAGAGERARAGASAYQAGARAAAAPAPVANAGPTWPLWRPPPPPLRAWPRAAAVRVLALPPERPARTARSRHIYAFRPHQAAARGCPPRAAAGPGAARRRRAALPRCGRRGARRGGGAARRGAAAADAGGHAEAEMALLTRGVWYPQNARVPTRFHNVVCVLSTTFLPVHRVAPGRAFRGVRLRATVRTRLSGPLLLQRAGH